MRPTASSAVGILARVSLGGAGFHVDGAAKDLRRRDAVLHAASVQAEGTDMLLMITAVSSGASCGNRRFRRRRDHASLRPYDAT
jgi:hypothetical protein